MEFAPSRIQGPAEVRHISYLARLSSLVGIAGRRVRLGGQTVLAMFSDTPATRNVEQQRHSRHAVIYQGLPGA